MGIVGAFLEPYASLEILISISFIFFALHAGVSSVPYIWRCDVNLCKYFKIKPVLEKHHEGADFISVSHFPVWWVDKIIQEYHTMMEDNNCSGSGICSAQKKFFIDVSKKFGVTSDGINKAIKLSRYPKGFYKFCQMHTVKGLSLLLQENIQFQSWSRNNSLHHTRRILHQQHYKLKWH